MNGPKERFAAAAVGSIAAAFFLVQFLSAFVEPYGYFLDELYYLACAKRPALGYVDHPPLAPLILRANVALLGDSVPALRLLPALVGALTLVLSGWMAHRMGGGRFAQTLAPLSLVVSPLPVVLSGFFSMNCFEILLWATACWILVEIARSGDSRLWLLLGVVLGIAFENKHTTGLLVAAVMVATLATPLRNHLSGRWLWLGALVAALLALPNLWWQVANGWPSLEFYRNLDSESNMPLGPLAVLGAQIGTWNPATFPVWLCGLVFFFSARGRPYRALGWVFVTLLVIAMVMGKSRADRIMGVYPVMFAAGGVLLESACRRRGWRWLRYGMPALLLAGGILMAPLLLPFPPAVVASHPLALDTHGSRREVGPAPIPIWLSHRLGSEEFVATVADVYRGLEQEQRRRVFLLAGDFAHAGAIEHFGPRYGLPEVFSGHNNYYFWGPGPAPRMQPSAVIAMGLDEELLRREFIAVERAAVFRCPYCMGWRDDLPIYVARGPRRTLWKLWPELKRFGLPTRKVLMLERRE